MQLTLQIHLPLSPAQLAALHDIVRIAELHSPGLNAVRGPTGEAPTGPTSAPAQQVAANVPQATAAATLMPVSVEAVRKELNPHLDGEHGAALKALLKEYAPKGGLPAVPNDKLPEFLDRARVLTGGK